MGLDYIQDVAQSNHIGYVNKVLSWASYFMTGNALLGPTEFP